MTAVQMAIVGRRYAISGDGYSTTGQITHTGGQPEVPLEQYLLPMALCADAEVRDGALVGDPTEGALVVLAAKGGVDPALTREQYPRVATLPFDAAYKMMATFHAMKDASGQGRHPRLRQGRAGPAPRPRRQRPRSGRHGGPDRAAARRATSPRTSAWARWACASWRPARRTSTRPPSTRTPTCCPLLDGLTLLAIVGIVDPPRPAAKAAIATAQAAGIQVRMITGDHAVTAEAIAHQLGIEGRAITGADFRALSDDEAMRQIDGIGVIARVSPEDKVHLVDILRKKGHVVAMTGDGVNDAPALKKADIGIAMGITGTEVSQAGRGHDPHRRQLRHDRQGGRPRARRLRQPAAVHPLPDGGPASGTSPRSSARRSSTSSAASRSCRSRPCGSTSRSTSSRAIGLGYGKPREGLMEDPPRPKEQKIMPRRLMTLARVRRAGHGRRHPGRDRLGDDHVHGDVIARTMGMTTFALFRLFSSLETADEDESLFGGSILAQSPAAHGDRASPC